MAEHKTETHHTGAAVEDWKGRSEQSQCLLLSARRLRLGGPAFEGKLGGTRRSGRAASGPSPQHFASSPKVARPAGGSPRQLRHQHQQQSGSGGGFQASSSASRVAARLWDVAGTLFVASFFSLSGAVVVAIVATIFGLAFGACVGGLLGVLPQLTALGLTVSTGALLGAFHGLWWGCVGGLVVGALGGGVLGVYLVTNEKAEDARERALQQVDHAATASPKMRQAQVATTALARAEEEEEPETEPEVGEEEEDEPPSSSTASAAASSSSSGARASLRRRPAAAVLQDGDME